jgi:hypothetical protein
MKYIKLFENFLIEEAANTNLEMKSIFKKLVYELRKMGLVVKFSVRKFDNESEFAKFIPSKNLYDGGNYNAYLIMDDDDRPIGGSTKLCFQPGMDKEKCKSYAENVKKHIDENYGDILECEILKLTDVCLHIKPKSSVNKSKIELSMDANKFMGLKRTPATDGVSYLVGSGWEYVSDNIEKTREFQLIKVDDSSKTVEINKGLVSELSKSAKKDKLVNIAKEFAKKNGYRYNAISNSFE